MVDTFAVKRHGHTDLFGIFLASHAVPDSFCLMHAGVGCKTKGQQHLVNHDWLRESFSRCGWSEISDIEVISGSEERLRKAAADWIRRRNPAVMAVTTAAFLEIRGENFSESLQDLSPEQDCRILYLPASGYDGDLYRGYAAYLNALLETLDWTGKKPGGDRVNIIGYLFDRYEMEHRANYNELNTLLGSIGLKLHRLLLSGAPYTYLRQAPEAELQILLPYCPPGLDIPGRPGVMTHLPLGLHGTKKWLETVGKSAGVNPGIVEKFIDGQLKNVVPVIEPAIDRLQGLRAAVFSDTPRAAALCGFLVEIGLEPLLVGLTDRTLGGRKAFLDTAAGLDAELPDSMKIIEDPSPRQLQSAVKEALEENEIDFIIASSYELRDLGHLPIPKIEMGFPSYEKHYLYPMPELGFAGSIALVQRLMDALLGIH